MYTLNISVHINVSVACSLFHFQFLKFTFNSLTQLNTYTQFTECTFGKMHKHKHSHQENERIRAEFLMDKI